MSEVQDKSQAAKVAAAKPAKPVRAKTIKRRVVKRRKPIRKLSARVATAKPKRKYTKQAKPIGRPKGSVRKPGRPKGTVLKKPTKIKGRQTSNALITETFLGIHEDRLTFFIALRYGSGLTQQFGGVHLDPQKVDGGKDCGGVFIRRVCEVVGVVSWEQLKGAHCRVIFDEKRVYSISNIVYNSTLDIDGLLAGTGNKAQIKRLNKA